jgi:hypothetical protein
MADRRSGAEDEPYRPCAGFLIGASWEGKSLIPGRKDGVVGEMLDHGPTIQNVPGHGSSAGNSSGAAELAGEFGVSYNPRSLYPGD